MSGLRVAVLSVTRDRLNFTKTCFASLYENAGCEFDFYVFDNGSTDGTVEWLQAQPFHVVVTGFRNVGISAAMNELLRTVERESEPPYERYDCIVKIDNDAQIVTRNALRDVCQLVADYGLILSPEIHGLRQPPATIGGTPLKLGDRLVDEKQQIGGIFLAAPGSVYDEFRYSESNPLWGGDDVEICAWWRASGGRCGYVRGIVANHFLGTDGQAEADVPYWERKLAEMAA